MGTAWLIFSVLLNFLKATDPRSISVFSMWAWSFLWWLVCRLSYSWLWIRLVWTLRRPSSSPVLREHGQLLGAAALLWLWAEKWMEFSSEHFPSFPRLRHLGLVLWLNLRSWRPPKQAVIIKGLYAFLNKISTLSQSLYFSRDFNFFKIDYIGRKVPSEVIAAFMIDHFT